MELSAYLRRIGFGGKPAANFETLRALHLAHQLAVPFENLDVQLRLPVAIDVESSFDKIVTRRRGGWCYEMNGIFGWALEKIGFEVTRMSAGVMREHSGDAQLGNHLCLLVQLDQPWLADVGFGGSLAAPFPLQTLKREDAPYNLELGETPDGYWRFVEKTSGDAFTFDFRPVQADESLLAEKCRALQSDPASPFVQNLVVQRRTRDAHFSLRGRVLTKLHGSTTDKRLLDSPGELLATLIDVFDLDVPEAAALWPAICARHEAVFG